MVKVMISGITNYDDALSATNLGADFVAFSLIKDSPKKVSTKLLKDVNDKLPPFVWAVGIFCDEDHKSITKTIQKLLLKAVQLNGNETPEYCKTLSIALGVKIFKYFKISSATDVLNLQPYVNNADYFVLDISNKDESGNITLALDVVQNIVQLKVPFFICGDIKIEQIHEVIEKTNPYGMIADESVERLQRRKDFDKMTAFIKKTHGLR